MQASEGTHATHPIAGVSRIREAFRPSGDAQPRCAVMPFVTAGYPDLATTERFLAGARAAGADLVEIGFPFSDPIADGPIIAESMHEALLAGVTPTEIFRMAARVPDAPPLVAMVSVSIVERIGAAEFIAHAVEAGFAGFIVPDADPIAARELASIAERHGAGWCPLVSPTTSEPRRRELAATATGFLYLLARIGITGERSDAPEVGDGVAALRSLSRVPVAVGFGISRPEHVAAVARHADGAIVGSAIVRAMRDARVAGADPVDAALVLVRALAEGARREG